MNTRHFQEFPKPYLAYPKVVRGLILKQKQSKQVLPQVEYVVDSFQIDQKHLNHYNEICGFKNNGQIPAIYLAMLSQSLQMHMMTTEAFPFAILGLVHIHNQITQFRPIAVDETLSLSTEFGELKPHDKGVQFDFITTAKVDGKVVMKSVMTYLSRQKTSVQATPIKTSNDTVPDYQLVQVWDVPENTGRRYAIVSGDFNLIHLHALSAKAFGFKHAIAHGMWSKARALANLELPEAYEVHVQFKLPIYLPSKVEFLTASAATETDFLIRNANSKKPHVTGVLRALS